MLSYSDLTLITSSDSGRENALYLFEHTLGAAAGASPSAAEEAMFKEYERQKAIYQESNDPKWEKPSASFKDLYQSNKEAFDIMILNGCFLDKVIQSAFHDFEFFSLLLSDPTIQSEIYACMKVSYGIYISDLGEQGHLFAQKLYEILVHKKFSEILKGENSLAKQLIDCLFNHFKDESSWMSSIINDDDLIQHIRTTILQSPQNYDYLATAMSSDSALRAVILGNTPEEFVSTLKALDTAPQVLFSLLPPSYSKPATSFLDNYFNAALEDPAIWKLFKDYITAPQKPFPRWANSTTLIEKLYDKSQDEFYQSLQQSQDVAYHVIDRVVSFGGNDLIAKIFSDKTCCSKIPPFKNALRFFDFLDSTMINGIESNSGLNAVREFLRANVLNSKIGNSGITFGEWLLKYFTLNPAVGHFREAIQWLGIS